MPKLVNAEERRQEIADAAGGVVARQGLDTVRFQDVSEELGWTTGVLTHFFKNKDDLLQEVLHQTIAQALKNGLSDPSVGEGLSVESLEGWLPIDAKRLKVWRIWMAFSSSGQFATRFAKERATYYRELTRVLKKALQYGIDTGQFRHGLNVPLEADSLIAFIDGIGARVALGEPWDAHYQRKLVASYLANLEGA